jgi:CRP-like cAMP-binding protein
MLSMLNKSAEARFFGDLEEFSGKRRTILARAGKVIDHVYFPTSGMISLLTVMRDGEAVETGAVGYDNGCGFNAALSGQNSNCQSVVQLAMTSLRIAKQPFCEAYDRSPAIRRMVHRGNEMLIEQLQQTAACHALHTVETRFARWLLQAHDYAWQDVLDLTQEFVSEMIGVRRASITEIALRLQTEGLITYRRGEVTIQNRRALEARSCECYRLIAESRSGKSGLKPVAVAPSGSH